ncbi:MAG: bifunctional nuclease domain-containing protein [Burkholderiales bacterium]
MEKIQLDILGLFVNKSQDATFTLLLGEVSGYRRLPIMIGMPEAQAIALAIEGRPLERPIMHDLFKETLVKLGYTVSEVLITMLQDEIFFAQLVLSDGIETIQLDARPSDAIAIALRFAAPLFIEENLLNEAGGILVAQIPDQETDIGTEAIYTQSSSKATSLRERSVDALKKLLVIAIEKEDYEQAARIRDELKSRNQ